CRPGGGRRRVRVCPSWREFGSSGTPLPWSGNYPERFREVSFTKRLLGVHHDAAGLTDGSSLLHRSFTNVNGEGMALLDRYRSAVDGLGGADDDPATPPFRGFDLEL